MINRKTLIHLSIHLILPPTFSRPFVRVKHGKTRGFKTQRFKSQTPAYESQHGWILYFNLNETFIKKETKAALMSFLFCLVMANIYSTAAAL